MTVRYPSGAVALQTHSDTSTFKWPSGTVAVSRLEDRVSVNYPNGSMAAVFDSNSNGSVTRPDGSTILSFSTSSCLMFEKVKGSKMNVTNVSTTSKPVRMELSKEVRLCTTTSEASRKGGCVRDVRIGGAVDDDVT